MPLTQNLSDIAEYLVSKIDAARDALKVDVVYYGDQQKLDAGVVVCVEPDEKSLDLKGLPRNMKVEFTVQIFVYHSLLQSPITSRRDNDKCAEAIQDLIHQDPYFGGLVIHGFVRSTQSGVATKSNSLVRATRMEYWASSAVMLPGQEG